MNDTNRLLREYCATGSESAFQELVTRYLDLVYSVAVRRLGGDTHQARDVAQTVFSDLARKAQYLPHDTQLGGWLHRHNCFIVNNFARTEFRRRTRELEAVRMNAIDTPRESSWYELTPVLDDALQDLEQSDRDVLMMRYFERRDLKSVGTVFGVSEDAAQKRVSR